MGEREEDEIDGSRVDLCEKAWIVFTRSVTDALERIEKVTGRLCL